MSYRPPGAGGGTSERGHGVWVQRFVPPRSDDQAAAILPGCSGRLTFFDLLAAMLTEHGHGFCVDADDAGPAVFGRSLNTAPPHDGS
jgi:hypothetical protein